MTAVYSTCHADLRLPQSKGDLNFGSHVSVSPLWLVVSCVTRIVLFSLFHCAFFNSVVDKTPTLALFIQHYISLAC